MTLDDSIKAPIIAWHQANPGQEYSGQERRNLEESTVCSRDNYLLRCNNAPNFTCTRESYFDAICSLKHRAARAQRAVDGPSTSA